MPHLSSQKLERGIEKQIAQQLVTMLGRSSSHLIKELLTETEQLMLAKRLAALLMLAEEFSYYRIAGTLGLSTSTIKRLHRSLLRDEFPSIERTVRSKKEREAFWKTMEVIFRAGLPPRGRGRWQGVDALLAKMRD